MGLAGGARVRCVCGFLPPPFRCVRCVSVAFSLPPGREFEMHGAGSLGASGLCACVGLLGRGPLGDRPRGGVLTFGGAGGVAPSAGGFWVWLLGAGVRSVCAVCFIPLECDYVIRCTVRGFILLAHIVLYFYSRQVPPRFLSPCNSRLNAYTVSVWPFFTGYRESLLQ